MRWVDRDRPGGGCPTGRGCSFAVTLGDDELSRFVLERLRQEGIDAKWIRHSAEARPIHSTSSSTGDGTRTIFYDLDGIQTTGPDWPDEDANSRAGVLFVDHVAAEDAIRAAESPSGGNSRGRRPGERPRYGFPSCFLG